MRSIKLEDRAIGAIRELVNKYTTRDGLKQLLLDAGAKSDRILRICVTNNMRSPQYKSKTTILNEGFDSIYEDFEKEKADRILLEMVRIIFSRNDVDEEDRQKLASVLKDCRITLEEIIEPMRSVMVSFAID
jgi:hypothetical protein